MRAGPNLVVIGSLLFAVGFAVCGVGGALGMSAPPLKGEHSYMTFTAALTLLGLVGCVAGLILLLIGMVRK